MSKPILCVDFDGVIHSYTHGWHGEDVIIDPPVPGELRWLSKATERFEVHIYSSRSKTPEGREAMRKWLLAWAKVEFGVNHPLSLKDSIIGYPVTFSSEKPPAFLTIDDRAICFTGSFDEIAPDKIYGFEPWNKK